MECSELYKDLNKLKSDFDKSYKSLTQNRSIQQTTINKHEEILVTRLLRPKLTPKKYFKCMEFNHIAGN